jgi:hypothetical protein
VDFPADLQLGPLSSPKHKVTPHTAFARCQTGNGEMTSISLNQTESEKRLNRILYYLKALRASILLSIFLFLAIALYMGFGITGVYPLAEDAINGLRPHLVGPERSAYTLVIGVTFLLAVGFLVWLYMSITRVWRKSLKAQSIFGGILIPIGGSAFGWYFVFSYEHLDPLFTILYGTYSVFNLWWIADI